MLTSYLFAEKFGWHPRQVEMLTEMEYDCFLAIEETLAAIRKKEKAKAARKKEKNITA